MSIQLTQPEQHIILDALPGKRVNRVFRLLRALRKDRAERPTAPVATVVRWDLLKPHDRQAVSDAASCGLVHYETYCGDQRFRWIKLLVK